MPAEKERDGREKGELVREERKREFFLISGCVRNGVQEFFIYLFIFFRQVAIEVEEVFKGRSGVWGGVWGVSPLPYRESLGGGSLDSAVGDR